MDSDGDGLNDYIECNILYTDPTKADTDEDGVIDSLEDLDGDGLTNAEELVYGTDPARADTDGDDLNDYEEVITYQSNPLKEDTDGDGLNDYDDIVLGFSPLKQDTDENGVLDPEEKVEQTLAKTFRSEEGRGVTQVAVSMTLSGNIERNVGITNIYEFDSMSRGVVGLVGIPVDINSKADFDSATITFTYDETLLGTVKEENLAVLWYDEENVWYQIMDRESVVDTVNDTVSYTTNHFSTYMLVDREAWFNAWNQEIIYDTVEASEDYENCDFLICWDVGVSKEDYERECEMVKKIVEHMKEDDWVRLCCYNIHGMMACSSPISKRIAAKNIGTFDNLLGEKTISIHNDGDFKICEYVDLSFDYFSNGKKIAVIINTGKNESANYTSLYNQAELCLSQVDYPIYAISINDNVNEKLDALLEKYGQQSWNIEEALDNIQNIPNYTQISDIDNDNDGLYDTYEMKGIKLPNGKTLYLKTNTRDSDEDGLIDSKEVGLIYTETQYIGFSKKKTVTYSKMYSDPTIPDTDGDDILDGVDDNPMLANEVVIELEDNHGFQYLNIVDENGAFTDAGDQGWWSGKINKAEYNMLNFMTDINLRLSHMGCGVIAMTDLEIYLAQKNGYSFTYPWPTDDFCDKTNAPTYDATTGCMDREEYMAYVEYNSRYKYLLGGAVHYYTGVMPLDMENGVREFLKHNNASQSISWAPYTLRRASIEKNLVVEQMEYMLSNNIPVVFAYFTSDSDKELILYKSVEQAKNREVNNTNEPVSGHYMTVIGLIKYLNEDGNGFDYVMKVTSWGEIYYINYQDYCKNFSCFSNILSIGKESE